MADLSGTYWDANPHMITALAAQKADYLFGGGLIVCAFTLSLLSYLFVAVPLPLSHKNIELIPWMAILATPAAFILLRPAARALASHYERAIKARLEELDNEHKRQREQKKGEREAEAAKRLA
jgi:hypothetical protein